MEGLLSTGPTLSSFYSNSGAEWRVKITGFVFYGSTNKCSSTRGGNRVDFPHSLKQNTY